MITAILAFVATAASMQADEAANARALIAEHDRQVRESAARLGRVKINKLHLQPPYAGETDIDPDQDPWVPVTQAAMKASNVDPYTQKEAYSLTANSDFDGDGVADLAHMANNSRHGAVIVTFGGKPNHPPLVAFKSDERFLAGEEIFAAGKSRILLNIPGARQHLLLMQKGKPQIASYGE
jgi:hypothetical protein